MFIFTNLYTYTNRNTCKYTDINVYVYIHINININININIYKHKHISYINNNKKRFSFGSPTRSFRKIISAMKQQNRSETIFKHGKKSASTKTLENSNLPAP